MLIICIGYKYLIGSVENVCQLPGTLERKFCLSSDFHSGKQGLSLHFMFPPKEERCSDAGQPNKSA